ncbi:MAG: iron ABC transporter permease [Hamadaea sp.]|uniref:ABC transporter permease n=1 Tax=Hamadaea sp. TaxID=2024425 RepID=UPI0017D37C84|nr:iron ABC transporter permease [Hamadaea sp.]NUT18771.1 iron ABC transporter permease [Hamadaea sp.]
MTTDVETSPPTAATATAAGPAPRRSRRRTTAGDRFIYLLTLPVFLVIAFFVVVPMLHTAAMSAEGKGLSGNYGTFLSGSARTALMLSIGTSLGSVVLCALVGTGLAVLLTRFDFPGRRALEVLAVLPMALPPLIGAVSFVLLFSETGIVPRAAHELLGVSAGSVSVTGVAGVLLVHTFTMYPYFYLTVAAGLAGLDPSLEEAAQNLGASRWKVWATVVLPMLTPALVSGGLLTFMRSMGSFTAPQLYNVQTLTMQIVATRTGGMYELAAAQSTVLAVVSIGFLLLMRWYQGRRIHRSLSKGIQRSRTTTRGWRSGLALAGSVALSLVLLAPIAVIVLVSFSVDRTWTIQVLPPDYTVGNYARIFTDPGSLLPINVSVQTSLIATGVALVIGVTAAWIIARWPARRGGSLLDLAVMVPWALPGTVIGINLVTAFSGESPWSLGLVLVGSIAILPVAYFVRFMPLVFRSTGAAIAQVDPSVDEAAQSLGASPLRALRTVVLPLIAKGVIAGALLAFVEGVGEYVASVIVYPVGFAPLSVAIYQRIYAADFGTASAYGTLQVVLIFIILVVSNRLEHGRRRLRRMGVRG